MATMSSPTTRLSFRTSPSVKALIKQAAQLEGQSMTEFIVAAASEAAGCVIAQHQAIALSVADSEAFVDALLNLPEPG